ncbi:hypothetical protein L1887_33696 [Cichorium endivia]|nr:hypothetical protein L1887_33696 [Cichorium endivia]
MGHSSVLPWVLVLSSSLAGQDLAHEILIQKGSVFSDRPRTFGFPTIASASFGPIWRVLRRNLASEILLPSHVKSYSWKLDEHRINEITSILRRALLLTQPGSLSFTLLNMFPRLGKILLRSSCKELLRMKNDQEQAMIPLIKSRIEAVKEGENKILTYVDTLVNLQLPEEETNNGNGGKLTHEEMVSFC